MMELELGLKITQTRDDVSSTAGLRISKGAGGVLFFSRETEAMFVLTGNLRGYRRKHIDISINQEGTEICISGRRPVQEKVIQGWIVQRKELEVTEFMKVFRIPRGVVLDRIKAKLNEDGSVLTVSMPKSVEGITGEGVEEVNEANGAMEGEGEELGQARQETELETPERTETEAREMEPKQQDSTEPLLTGARANKDAGVRDKGRRKKFKICAPAIAGSALLVSLIVFVISSRKPKHR
ncbi:hypothetical protein SAY87_014226 [Trapa incisa]|uniref:SHSP domain-containing protein n=1 Tax=Trapa incisa TaxID=236973 RepID=A0AAN7JL08_9MYRT|nr:hypothetical protein SAY87_014226 [Trapa incisa]